MKKFLIALFTIFACGKTFAEPNGGFIPPIPPIYAHPDVVEYAIKKYVVAPYDPNKVTAAYEQYMNQNDGTITLENLQQKVCPAGGMDYTRCKEFTNALMIPYYDVCDSGKGKSGGNEHCEKNFFYYAAPKNLSFGNGTYVRTKEAIGLAQEYALVKDKQKVVCVSTKGNSKKTDTIWCASIDKKHFYEFKFNNIKETKDDYIKQSLLGAICKLHNTQYSAGGVGAATLGSTPGYSWPDSCETADKLICANINKSLGRFSYKATIGTSDVPPTGKHSTCVIEKVVNDISNLRSAYGIDPAVFKNVQALAGEDIDNKIKQYVKQELQKQKITFDEKSFHCADSTNVLNGGDVLTCYVNNKPIDFLFKDLSEWTGVNKRGGAQAMDCIVSGGTYTGKRCTNLNQKQCEMLRSANLKSCPSCNMVRWDAKNNVCTLPSSAAATNFQKDIKLVGMAAGAVASVAITIATAGTAGLTIGGYIILGVETTGAGIELWSQSKINKLSDEFFLKSNNCYSENCAAQLIETYLTDLAAIDRDLTADEADAVDKEMARLVELIPTNSNWWIDKLRNEDGTSFLEKADNGHWTAAQVWRAVGIGMQFAGVASSVTGWIIKKAHPAATSLEKTLDKTSQILLKNARVAEKNIVKYENLSDIDKEFWVLWQEYAPKNQTFEQFKAMSNGDLEEMRRITKNMVTRNKRSSMPEQARNKIYDLSPKRQQALIDLNSVMAKHNITELPKNKTKLEELYKLYPDLKQAGESFQTVDDEIRYWEDVGDLYHDLTTSYSTYNPEFSAVSKPYEKKTEELRAWWREEYKKRKAAFVSSNPLDDFNNSESYKQLVDEYGIKYNDIAGQYQWEIGDKFTLDNLGNVVNERADDFAEIINNNPEIKLKLKDWTNLEESEKRILLNQIVDKYGIKRDTYVGTVEFDATEPNLAGYWDGTKIALNPTSSKIQDPAGVLNTLTHEHAHMIDELAPNDGALGEQFQHYADNLYSNKRDNGYRISLTEQSSWKIGPNASKKSLGASEYDEEWELENAKENLKYLQTSAKGDKIVFDETTEAKASEVASGLSSSGLIMGSTKQIQETNKQKNIFEKYNEQKGK